MSPLSDISPRECKAVIMKNVFYSLMNWIRLSFKSQVQITVLPQVRITSTQHRISYSEVRTYLQVVKVRSKKNGTGFTLSINGKLPKGAVDDKIGYCLWRSCFQKSSKCVPRDRTVFSMGSCLNWMLSRQTGKKYSLLKSIS